MLGHASLETTQIYTKVSIRALKAIHTATHPGKMPEAGKRRLEAESELTPEAVLEALSEDEEE